MELQELLNLQQYLDKLLNQLTHKHLEYKDILNQFLYYDPLMEFLYIILYFYVLLFLNQNELVLMQLFLIYLTLNRLTFLYKNMFLILSINEICYI